MRAETGESFTAIVPVTDRVVDLAMQPAAFYDEPTFTVAGVIDNTYRGGHGSDTVLRSEEQLAKATASLGTTTGQENDPLEAVRELQRNAEANPSEANLFNWGTELLSHRSPEASVMVFTRGVNLFPNSVRMLLGLASAQYSWGKYPEAERSFLRATDLYPRDPKPYLFLAKVQAREITQSAEYAERMARFAQLQPHNPWANYYYAASIWDRSGDGAQALEYLRKAVELDPHLGMAYLLQGRIAVERRRYVDAIAEFRHAIQDAPDLVEAHYRLSETLRLTGDRAGAARELSTYHDLSKKANDVLERERREVQRFVIDLHQTQ